MPEIISSKEASQRMNISETNFINTMKRIGVEPVGKNNGKPFYSIHDLRKKRILKKKQPGMLLYKEAAEYLHYSVPGFKSLVSRLELKPVAYMVVNKRIKSLYTIDQLEAIPKDRLHIKGKKIIKSWVLL